MEDSEGAHDRQNYIIEGDEDCAEDIEVNEKELAHFRVDDRVA
jgi:hypothetical protein